jgi:hypothetical protein
LNYRNSIALSARVSVDEWQYGLLGPYWVLSDNMLYRTNGVSPAASQKNGQSNRKRNASMTNNK